MRPFLKPFPATRRLGKRLIFWMILSSALLSSVAAGMQLYLSYQSNRAEATSIFTVVERGYRKSLENALWQFNFAQVNTILDGIFADIHVINVELVSSSGHEWRRGEGQSAADPVSHELVLQHFDGSGTPIHLGTLSVGLTLDNVNAELWRQFLTLFLSSLAKTFLASLIMLALFEAMVTRHLRRTSRYVDRADWMEEGAPLTLERPTRGRSDELDGIVSGINHARGLVVSAVDTLREEVEERRRAEKEATHASEARKKFISTMSHEIRTPLNAIMGLLELIERSDIPDKQRARAKAAQTAANALLGQLTNVLEVSRLEASAIDISLRREDIDQLGAEIEHMLEAAVAMSGKDLKWSLETGPVAGQTILIDRRRVMQIMHNLIDNAVRFTDAGSITIQFSTEPSDRAGPDLWMTIIDTGCGIPSDQIGHIFDPFTQLADVATRRYGGTGLGLSICQELSAIMGGRMDVESAPEKGSRFSLMLPGMTIWGDDPCLQTSSSSKTTH